MSFRLFQWIPLPKSLRWQFMLALVVPALMVVAGSLTAISYLRSSSYAARQLAETRLARLQQAQDLVQCTLLIERESHRMLTTVSLDAMQGSYRDIQKKLDQMDSLVLRLGQASDDLSVLALNQSGQLFRSTVHMVVQLRKNLLTDSFPPSEAARQRETLLHFHSELQRQAMSLVDATRGVSTHFTDDYQEAMRRLTSTLEQHQWRMLALMVGSILLAWLAARHFLNRRVELRLQQISNRLRFDGVSLESISIPVQGDDEIGEMARAVEQYLAARCRLAKAQSELKQNEEMLRAVIDAAPTAIIGLDLDGNVHSVWNRAAERMLGWSAGEVMGRPLPTVQTENEEEFRRFREQIRNGLNLDGIEVRRKRRDGAPIDYSIYASPLHDHEGNINGNIAVLVDITQRKQIMDALRNSESRLQDIIDSTSDWIWEVDAQGVYTFCSGRIYHVLGYSPEEVLGRTPFDLMAPEECERIGELFAGFAALKSRIVNVENWNLTKDGRRVCLLTNGVPIIDSEGRHIGYRGADQDITEKKMAEAALVFERRQLLSIFDSMDQIVFVSDPRTYEILYVNQSGRRDFPKDIVGGICYKDYRGFDSPCSFCTNEIILKQKPFPFRWEYYDSSLGKHFDIVDRVITWPDGRDVRLEFATDITERKLLDDQLQQKNEDLARSNAELDDFAYIVSHDLKEPLRSIRSFSSFLLEDHRERLDSEGQSHLDIVIQSATRMESLLDDLLTYSRVGRAELAKRPTDLGQLVTGVLEDMRTVLAERNAHISIAADLPTVICDHVRVGEVFRNLIQNAIKYNDSEEKQIMVGWVPGDASEQGEPVFFVRDNGIGIREKHLDSIFKIFKRLHGRDEYGGGTGSGLTIVRKIIERHGGLVWVESEFGKGSTFYFTLGTGA